MPPDNFQDVQDFHQKFGVGPHLIIPHLPPHDVFKFRLKFLKEELQELEDAYAQGDLPKYFDALLDLVYVALGTADLSSLPWQDGWNEVQRANMSKVRASSAIESLQSTGRGHRLDVIKPPGWSPPDLNAVLTGAKDTSPVRAQLAAADRLREAEADAWDKQLAAAWAEIAEDNLEIAALKHVNADLATEASELRKINGIYYDEIAALRQRLERAEQTVRNLRDERKPRRAREMNVAGALFGFRFIPGCDHGCVELYIEDDGWFGFQFDCDRIWLNDLAQSAARAAALAAEPPVGQAQEKGNE